MMLIDTVFSVFFNIFQYFSFFFNIFQYFSEDDMKMLIDTVEGEDTLSSQMIASTSGNMIALRASSALEAMILSQPKLFLFIGR